MTCAACSLAIEKSVSKLDGIGEVKVNLITNTMEVVYDNAQLDSDAIIKAVEKAGYGAEMSIDEIKVEIEQKHQEEKLAFEKRLKISLLFTVPLLYITMGHMLGLPLPEWMSMHEAPLTFGVLQLLLTMPVVYMGRSFYTVGFKTLWKRYPNMDSLIAIGTSAAILYGLFALSQILIGTIQHDMALTMLYVNDLYFESAAVILTLITVGKYLESRAKAKTSDAIKKLIDLSPQTALLFKEGKTYEIDIKDVKVDDILVVKPGATIPVDGMIIEGESAIDESMLTGESIPVSKGIGEQVIGASLNKSGYFKMKAERVGNNTMLSQIIKLVQEAQGKKAPIAKIADQISSIFVPAVLGLALLGFIVWVLLGYSFVFSMSIAITILVISCPCALGLATPTAIMVGTGKGAEYGILIKGGVALENTHLIDTVVLDKTGTITEGKPTVTDVISYEIPENDLLQIVASIEEKSEHPLAEGIIRFADEKGISLIEVPEFESLSGLGLSAQIKDSKWLIGNEALMNQNKISMDHYREAFDQLTSMGKTPMFIAKEHELTGIIGMMDVPKPNSEEAIHALMAAGIDVIMLTGDHKKTAESIQRQLGIPKAYAEVFPHEKAKVVEKLMSEGRKVAMVGDGINDSPALALADIGIAIGNGTDIAIESADIVLMKSDLRDVVTAIELSRKTIRNIKQNLFWAFFYNVLGIPVAAGVFYLSFGFKLNPMFAAAAMSLSSFTVVMNALRLRGFKPEKHYRSGASTKVYETYSFRDEVQNQVLSENAPIAHDEDKRDDQEQNESKLELKTDLELKTNETRIKNEIKIQEDNEMKKEMLIEGMSCGHCKMRVEKALNGLEGVENAEVALEEKKAFVTLSSDVDDVILKTAVEEAGYEVVEVK
ncbi:cadmium-translocating P-type ATPase [Fusibacter sp. Q10-2]|uniref:Copper-exporting P-type ATPase n=2 Tax=Fusibacter ferrireducens TaxID=2785058 RepID=A0ABR9ZV33_9FIRM|nr:cadmium-translocating P-type ATPase [Fusibacter ferrireducens]